MPSHLFSGKKKEDLIEIVRLMDVLPISQARKMKKSELIEYLEAHKDQPSTPEQPQKKKRGRTKARSHLLPEEQLKQGEDTPSTKHSRKVDSQSSETATAGQEGGRRSSNRRKRGRKSTAEKAAAQVQETEQQKVEVVEETSVPEESSPVNAADSTESQSGNRSRSRRGRNKRNRSEDSNNRSADAVETTTEEGQSLQANKRPAQILEVLESVPEWAMPEIIEETPSHNTENRNRRGGSRRPENNRQENSRRNGDENRQQSQEKLSSQVQNNRKDAPVVRALASEPSEAESAPAVTNNEGESNSRGDTYAFTGILNLMPDGFGFAHPTNYLPGPKDVYISPQMIRRFHLRAGDELTGTCRHTQGNRNAGITYLYTVNGHPVDIPRYRQRFDRLTPIYPDTRLVLETGSQEFSTRIIDLISPIGKGQRGLIVSPPKAGKTVLLKKVANAITQNNPEARLMVLLVDERPEEVTDMQRSIQGEVVYSTFDKSPENHVRLAELVLERAMRLVEEGEDVVILLDSITRLARAYNLTINPTGRTLSGGVDPGALYGPKRFFGAARNIEDGGSLTILATALVETGSRMDEVIFEEFKGTGNMEVYLDRKLSEKRIFPAIDINRSGTRREELLLNSDELEAVWNIRKAMGQLDTAKVTEMLLALMQKQGTNSQFVRTINASFIDKAEL